MKRTWPGLVVAAIVMAVPFSPAAEAQQEPPAPDTPAAAQAPPGEPPRPAPALVGRTRQDAAHPHLESSLRDDLAQGRPVHPATTAGATPGAPASRSVTVVVEAPTTEDAVRAVRRAGGRVDIKLEGVVQADVPAAALGQVADARGVALVREPRMARPEAVTSEGVATTGADAWHLAAQQGAGVKVAVVDLGFAGYSTLYEDGLGEEELPPDARVSEDFSRCGNPAQTDHGTAVAEIVHDMAPGADLHLVCVDTDIEFASALATLAGLGVKIVNGSIGFTLTGRGDGSGGSTTPSGAVRALRKQGVLYVAAAGNYGASEDAGGNGRHWHGAAKGDTDGAGGADFVNISADDALYFAVDGSETAYVQVQWDSWSSSSRLDFDVYVVSESGFCPVGEGESNQAGGGVPPVELIAVPNCSSSPQWFFIFVNRYNGSATPRLDIFVDGVVCCLESATASSVADPGTSHAALTVGAHCHATGVVEPYSSQGPTIDGRIKPDISAPDGTSGFTYGDSTTSCEDAFTGTSASAPHVAGAAALLLGANPTLDVAVLQQLLLDRATDAGAVGKDNRYGAGRLQLGVAGDAAPPDPQPFTPVTPLRLYDTRSGQGAAEPTNRTTPVGAGVANMLTIQVRDIAGIPADATAVVLNVAVTGGTSSSYLTVQPGTTKPLTSNLNFSAGQTFAQHVTATVAPDDKIRIFNAAGSVHVIVDLNGWYGPTTDGATPATGLFTPLAAPVRAFHSGTPNHFGESPARNAPLAPNELVTVALGALPGLPVDATGVILNVTVFGATYPGYLTVHPGGTSTPTASSINAPATRAVGNLVVVGLGAADDIRMRWRGPGTAHVVVDVIGWFAETSGAGYVPLPAPARQLDSRYGTGPRLGAFSAGGTLPQDMGYFNGVPGDAAAVTLAVAAIGPTSSGYLTVYPTGQTRPTTSSVNFSKGGIYVNAVVTGLGSTGRASIYAALSNTSGVVHVVSDVSGYFIEPVPG